jgi:hypothetical protein
MVTNSGKFTPDTEQLAFMEVMRASGYEMLIAPACEKAALAINAVTDRKCTQETIRQHYYGRWMDDPAFMEWYNDQVSAWTLAQTSRIQAAIVRSATDPEASGDPRAQKLFLERFDPKYCPKTQADVRQTITIEAMTQDEQSRIAGVLIDALEDFRRGRLGTGPVIDVQALPAPDDPMEPVDKDGLPATIPPGTPTRPVVRPPVNAEPEVASECLPPARVDPAPAKPTNSAPERVDLPTMAHAGKPVKPQTP